MPITSELCPTLDQDGVEIESVTQKTAKAKATQSNFSPVKNYKTIVVD
jgi:hypothetical protein